MYYVTRDLPAIDIPGKWVTENLEDGLCSKRLKGLID